MNLILQCPQHKQQIIQACVDLECAHFPFMCKQCIQESNQQHAQHTLNLKSFEHYLQITTKLIEDHLVDHQKYKEIFNKEPTLLKYFQASDDHLNNIEGFIRTTKDQIQTDFTEMIDTYVQLLTLERDSIIDKLDTYLKTYKTNFCNIKDLVEPIHYFISKCKYYANDNNLKLKLHTDPSLGTQIKMSIKALSQVQKPDFLKSAFDILNNSQIPIKYDSHEFRNVGQNAIDTMRDHLRKKINVVIMSIIDIPEPVLPAIPVKSPMSDIECLEEVRTMPPEDPVTQPIPIIGNISIIDKRIIEDTSTSPYFKQQKFKIKKKLSLEFIVTSLVIIGDTQVVLGLKDGTLKLLDLQTSKVSFFPHTFIYHTQPVCNIIQLKQNKGIRLASTSDENYVIIWTLGEHYVPYPERKLVGFKNPIFRVMDITDGAHLVCQSVASISIVNYNDNRTSYSFDTKVPIIEFLYVSKFQTFATICQNNIVQIYSLKMNNIQGAMLLVNCELEHSIPAVYIGNITACIAIESNGDIVICYGCIDGSVKLFNVLKNTIIGDIQLFNSRINELIMLRQKKNFTLVVLAENDKTIKGIQLDGKLSVIDKYGELLEQCAKSKSKNLIQPFIRNSNKCALLTLNETQKDIGLYELC